MPAQVRAITQEVVLAVTMIIPLNKQISLGLYKSIEAGTYIQSKRASFSRRVPSGVFNFRNANTSAAATPQIGRFISVPRMRLVFEDDALFYSQKSHRH